MIGKVAELSVVIIDDNLTINGGFRSALEAEEWRWVEVTKTKALFGELLYGRMLIALVTSTMNSSVHELIGRLSMRHNAPVVVFCANCPVPDLCQALAAGAEEVISIPFAQAEAIARLRAVARVRVGSGI